MPLALSDLIEHVNDAFQGNFVKTQFEAHFSGGVDRPPVYELARFLAAKVTDLYDSSSSDAQNLTRLITCLDLNIEQLVHVLERLKALLEELPSNDQSS